MAIGGLLALKFGYGKFVGFAGEQMRAEVDAGLTRLKYPPEEKAAVLFVLMDFENKVRQRKIPATQVPGIIEEVLNGPAMAAFLARTAQIGFLDKTVLSPAEQAQAHLVLNRYIDAVARDGQDYMRSEEFLSIVDALAENPDQAREALKDGLNENSRNALDLSFKSNPTRQDLNRVLGIMTRRADAAGSPARPDEIDLPGLLRRELDQAAIK
jgi:hypothetical protein